MTKLLIYLCILVFALLPNIAFCLPDFHLIDVRHVYLGKFFEHYNCPVVNFTLIDSYIKAADKHLVDYRLLPAISLQESSCLKKYPLQTHNPWGWASAEITFDSLDAGIDYVTNKLAVGRYYKDKDLNGKLRAYNPNPGYAPKIIGLMKQIEP